MQLYIDVLSTALRLHTQLYLSSKLPQLVFTEYLAEASLVIGFSYENYPMPSIKFTDRDSTIAEDELCMAMVPFPDSTEALDYLVLEVSKCL
jgi:hypothetical protein